MEKSAFFNSKLLPYLLLVPQLIITFVFFYWPASQAVWQSFLREDAFGLTSEFVGLEKYKSLFFLAGLQSIPRSVLEAGAIDGAGPMRRFWTIVFPLLSPTTFFLLVVNIVYVFFDTFGIIDAVTGGGPAGSTTTMVYKVYADGRLGGDLGSSAAQSVVLMVIVIALTAIQFRYVERKVQY